MAQLRDIHTSELVFEGTPEECLLVAEKVGRDEVLFDGVGEDFDPDAALASYNDRLSSEVAMSKLSAEGITEANRDAAKERASDLAQVESDAAANQPDVEQALADVRARLED